MNIHPTESLPAYVLGALDAAKAAAVAEHLRHCPQCRAEADEFRAIVGLHTEAMPLPAAHVKRRLFARVRASQRQRTHQGRIFQQVTQNGHWITRAAFLVVVVLLLGSTLYITRRQIGSPQEASQSLEQTPASATSSQAQEDVIAAFLNAPATVSQAMNSNQSDILAQMYMQPGLNRAVLVAQGLPQPQPGTTYQFWFATPSQQVPLQTFGVDASGDAKIVLDAPAPVDTYTEVMVTVEPSGGSITPSTQVVLSAKLIA